MTDLATDLATSLIAVFSTYVEERLEEQGLERPPSLDDALAEGEAWLGPTLEELLSLPFDEQRRGPLEVFQEAMRFPTDALAGAGVEAVVRDPGAVAALPGDVYNLAPASSRQLGDGVWMAHLEWGATKARALHGSSEVGLLSADLMDRSRVEQMVARSGAQLVAWDGRVAGTVPAEGRLPGLVLVDLAVPDAIAAIERLVQAGVRVIAFGPHVDGAALRSARQAGADEVLARSVFFQKLGAFLG
ncbi:MAG: hypothetical protein OEM84_07810 [Acidimicrobiia bacterium]|nr:hypothetical protein [Acidimicrobiia bacterium]MDH5616906.1 hypothetical protein [Acidimicrobiia bacterium]